MKTLDQIKKTRIEKLQNLQKMGINPYPCSVSRTHTVSEAKNCTGQVVAIVGRVMGVRKHGKVDFHDLIDESGGIQIVYKADKVDKEKFQLLEYIDIGDFLEVKGEVGKTQAGEISVFATDFSIITKSIHPLPDQWFGLKDIEERYRRRYVDMILNPQVRERIKLRGKVIQAMRDFLTVKGFVEVETPTLQPIYGGGFARPFKTYHYALDANFYLRISDEMYLKRLIVGGFEKVFEITKVFRNEGVDHDHNPEFTMFEAQIAYEDYTYGMDIIEEIIEYSAQKVLGKTKFIYQEVEMDVKRPWKRYTVMEAIKKFVKIDPLKWKSLSDAKSKVKKLPIEDIKKKHIDKIQSIGEVIAFVFEEMVEGYLLQPTIIYDFPVEVSPLAKKSKDPRFTQRFEQFAFGTELGNNYTELNDPIDLRQRFVEEKKREAAGFAEAHQTDNDYLEAIEHGFPPTCGIAIGIDRLVMLFTDAKNIKEVIAFPTLRPIQQAKAKMQVKSVITRVTNQSTDTVYTQKLQKGGTIMVVNRDKAWEILTANMQNKNLIRHCLAVEAVMKALAGHFGENEELWGVVGLLHDGDYEKSKDDPAKHTILMAQWLKDAGETNQQLLEAILSHNYAHTGKNPPKNNLEWSLYCCDELTGLIVAVTLVRPEKKIASVTYDSIMKKWKNESFAAGVHRPQIEECETRLGIKLADFIELSLKAMQGIASEIGL